MQPRAAAEMALNLNAPSMQPSYAIYSVLLAFQLIKAPPDVTMMVSRCEAPPGSCTLQLPTESIVSPKEHPHDAQYPLPSRCEEIAGQYLLVY